MVRTVALKINQKDRGCVVHRGMNPPSFGRFLNYEVFEGGIRSYSGMAGSASVTPIMLSRVTSWPGQLRYDLPSPSAAEARSNSECRPCCHGLALRHRRADRGQTRASRRAGPRLRVADS